MPIASNPVERAWNSDEHRAYAVAIVGGGFAGVMTAIHLLRVLPAPSEIVLFERGGRLGGPAYGTGLPCHLLNVPAARMSAFPRRAGRFRGLALPHRGRARLRRDRCRAVRPTRTLRRVYQVARA